MKVKKIDQKGQVLIFVSLAFILLGLLAGLGIDLGRGYLMKAQLMRTADAAALAGAKALKGQVDFEDEAIIAACDAAEMNGLTCGQGSGFDMSVSFVDKAVPGGPDMRFIEITANASIPTTLLSLLNLVSVGDFSTLSVSAFSQGGPERPVDLMLVLDRSGSMGSTGGTGQTKIDSLKAAVNSFLDNTFSPDDRVGMVSFARRGCGNASGTDYAVNTPCVPDRALGTSIATLKAAVNALVASGGTNTMEALLTGGNEINGAFADSSRERSRKAVLLVTDGQPTAMRRFNDLECKSHPITGAMLPSPGNGNGGGGPFDPNGCLFGVSSVEFFYLFRRPLNNPTCGFKIPSSGTSCANPLPPNNAANRALYKDIIRSTRDAVHGAMYEANKIRNYGLNGAKDVVIYAIAIGQDLGPGTSDPQGSLDENAKCLLARIANDPGTINNCSSVYMTTADGDTHADLNQDWPPCGITPCIDQAQEKGKVFTVDVNGNVQAQLQAIFAEVAALLKLRLTI